jgi:argininosuccinate lyase
MLKGLPLAYQRDLQEDKPPLFDAAATAEASLRIMAGLIATLSVNAERMAMAAGEGHTTATAVADALVRRGIAFRVAHHVVGGWVGQAERRGITLEELEDEAVVAGLRDADDDAARRFADDPGAGDAVRASASIEGALAGADVVGGTAPGRVREQLRAARTRLGQAG